MLQLDFGLRLVFRVKITLLSTELGLGLLRGRMTTGVIIIYFLRGGAGIQGVNVPCLACT